MIGRPASPLGGRIESYLLGNFQPIISRIFQSVLTEKGLDAEVVDGKSEVARV